MVQRTSPKPTAQRFIDATLELIEEQGGSSNVNLRQVARRVGCAHTNAYNYFSSFDALMWEAFRRALVRYGEYLIDGLQPDMAPARYLERLLTNLARVPETNAGLHRFLASDPIDLERIPHDVLAEVAGMKQWLADVFAVLFEPQLAEEEAERIANIVLAYVDGETLNLINGRVVPGEDIHGRVVENALRLVRDLSGLELEDTATGDWHFSIEYSALNLSGLDTGA